MVVFLIFSITAGFSKGLSGSQALFLGDFPLSFRGTFFSSLLNPASGGELERFHFNSFYGTFDEESVLGLGIAFPTLLGTWGLHFINYNTDKNFIGAAGLYKMTGGGFTYTREIAEDVLFGFGFKAYSVESGMDTGFIANADLGLSSFFKVGGTPVYWSFALSNLGLPTSLDGFESFPPMGARLEIQPRLKIFGENYGLTKPFVSLFKAFHPAGLVMSTGLEQEIGILTLGAGVSFDVYGEHYQEQGLFFLSLGAEHDFGQMALSANYTLYPQANYNLDDKKEVKHLFSLTFKFGSVDREGPRISVNSANLIEKDNVIYLSPNNDNINDYLSLAVELEDSSMVREWKFKVMDETGKVVYNRGDAITKDQFSLGSFKNILRKKRGALIPAGVLWPGVDEEGKVLPDGRYTYQIIATDFKGNEAVMGTQVSPESQTMIIDTKAPKLETQIPNLRFSPNGDGNQDSLLIKHQDVSEDAYWYAKIKSGGTAVFRKEWQDKPSELLEWDGKNEDGKALPDGVYEYSIHGEDKAGNQFSQVIGNVLIDTRSPEVKAVAGDNYFSPNGDGIKDTVSLLQQADKEGEWVGEIKDPQGKIVRTFIWNKLPARNLIWDGKDEQKAILPDGKYDYYLRGRDLAGNTTQQKLTTFIVDNTPPAITLSSPELYFSPNGDGIKDFIVVNTKGASSEDFWKAEIRDKNNKSVRSFYWNDAPPEAVQWDGLDKDGKKLPEGRYSIVLFSQDRAGNTHESAVNNIVLDVTPPEVGLVSSESIFSPNADGRKDTTELKISLRGAAKSQLQILDKDQKIVLNRELSPQSGSFSWDGRDQKNQILPDGHYQALLQGEDEAGNKALREISLTVLNLEEKLLLVADKTVINPRHQGYNVMQFSTSIPEPALLEKWGWKLQDKEGRDMDVIEDRNKPKANTLNWKFGGIRSNQEMLSDGLYSARVFVHYQNGDVLESNAVPFRVDKTGPQVKLDFNPRIFSPDGDGEADLLNINLDAQDPSGISAWHLVIEDRFKEEFKGYKGGNLIPKTIQWDGNSNGGQLTDSAEDYYMYAVVSDGVGNVTRTQRLPFTIDILVMKTDRGYKIRISNIQFELNKAVLQPQAIRILERVAEKLGRFPNYQIRVEGHADKTGPEGWNEQLSLLRSQSVIKYLVDEKELNPKMFKAEGFGSRIPLYPNDSPTNRARNRRVEFILLR